MKKIILIFFSVFIWTTVLTAMIPGWLIYQDKDGNSYFVDDGLKIQTTEEPGTKQKAVTSEGIHFYFEHAVKLYYNHHKVESLRMLKSIRFLGTVDDNMYNYSAKASKQIELIRKREGSRFNTLNIEAEPILVKSESFNYLVNYTSGYKFRTEMDIEILERKIRQKHNYILDGISVGLKFNSNSEKYDLLMYLNSEKFHYNILNIGKYRELTSLKVVSNWSNIETVRQSRYSELIFAETNDNRFNLYELYLLNKNRGYFVQTFFVKNNIDARNQALKIVKQLENGSI